MTAEFPFPTVSERHPGRLLWYLMKCNYDLESAYKGWLCWVTWCRTHAVEKISVDNIQMEIDTKVAYWEGHDKLNRPCLVITGRNHDPYGRIGNWKTFKMFMIYTVEKGVQQADQRLLDAHLAQLGEVASIAATATADIDSADAASHIVPSGAVVDVNLQVAAASTSSKLTGSPRQYGLLDPSIDIINTDANTTSPHNTNTVAAVGESANPAPSLDVAGQVCILYDRRGMGDEHIDPTLYAICRELFSELQMHYGSRLGMIYILHMNWFFWLLYQYIIQPFIELYNSRLLCVVETPSDLIVKNLFASEEEVCLQSYMPTPLPEPGTPSDIGPEQTKSQAPNGERTAGPNTRNMMQTLRSTGTTVTDAITGFTVVVESGTVSSTVTTGAGLTATADAASIDR